MSNPWQQVSLSDYESHMQLPDVGQLQALNTIMRHQFNDFPVKTLCVLGVAGGNGLEHIDRESIEKVYGVDINEDYLNNCRQRHGYLGDTLSLLKLDLTQAEVQIPAVDLIVANLLIEYIGLDVFCAKVRDHSAKFVSCVIQKNNGDSFVSTSPYQDSFGEISQLHHDINDEKLIAAMQDIGFSLVASETTVLPNLKQFATLDFQRQ
ncbi:class I SAM-dependent methyltransferase [Affinibrenneria salicis]|uniref:Class I SAM-dependent methyltransferase n=1 Tax=Affinibrenneria salicis TaxID=2590031 RepID=A0A5J5G2T7_9GAMM|nr:class I SAM-dependent methyltransferase [Affinibrenneria salicis]KAA9001178.1 class I SAM-dependent methyltransferase [Affinibrenneria salicis]